MKKDKEKNFIRDYLASGLFPERPLPMPPADLDWARLALLLSGSRLSAHFLVLGKEQQDLWEASFRDSLKKDRYSLMLYGDQCALHIRSLLLALNEASVPVIVLKGWAFIPTIYGGDYSQRACEDIDILVRPQDVDLVEELLHKLNFSMAMEGWAGYNRRYWNGARYFVGGKSNMPGSTFSIGLHWGLWHTPSYDAKLIDIEALFERARPLEVVDIPVLELSVEDRIVYTAAHIGLHHLFDEALFRYYELAANILRADPAIKWEQVFSRASRWHVVLPLRYVLGKTKFFWNEIIPTSVIDELDDLEPTRREFFTEHWIKITRGHSSFSHILHWLTFPDWKKRFLIVLQDIFPSPAYMRHRYGDAPGGIWLLLYFKRFFHAFGFFFK